MQTETNEDFNLSLDDRPSRLVRVRNAISVTIGALVALALLMTLGIWFYRLGVRDAQNVPIIRAALDPAKTRPADPGGASTPHQGISSYEVAEAEPPEASASAAVVAPAPAEPSSDDVAMAALQPQPKPEAEERAEVKPSAPDVETPAEAREQSDEQTAAVSPGGDTSNDDPVQAQTPLVKPEPEPAAQQPEKPEPEQQVAALSTEQAEPEAATAAENVPEESAETEEFKDASEFAPAASPAAPARPRDLLARVETAQQEAERSVADLANRAANSAVQIQLAADPSEDYIRRKWREVSRANADLLRDRALAVQTTKSGGKLFYRLRIGPFKDGAEARAVCQALKARGQDCIVARNG